MFNTLRYAKILEEVGFSREQAETSVKILSEIMEDKLASKQDLQDLGIAMKHDMQELRTEVKHDIREFRNEITHSMIQLESRMTIKLGTMLAATIAILTAIQKLV